MKKNCLFATLLFFCTIQQVSAALPTGACPCDINVPRIAGGPTIGLMGIRWDGTAQENDYVIARVLHNRQCSSFETFDYQTVNSYPIWNFKVTFGYIFPCSGNEITLAYLNFDQGANRFVQLDSLTSLIIPTLSDQWPATASITIFNPSLGTDVLSVRTNPNFASASTSVHHEVLDLDYGQSINVGSQMRLKYYGGLRYAKVKNTLNAVYNFIENNLQDTLDGVVPDTGITVDEVVDFHEEVNQSSHYEGVGPHLGTNLDYYLNWGFGLVADLSASVLSGNTCTSLDESFKRFFSAQVISSDLPTIPVGKIYEQNEFSSADITIRNRQRIVPNIDARIGIDWSYKYCNCARSKLNIEIGYMVSHYIDIINRTSEADIHHPEFRANHKMSEHFEGFYAGIQFNL